VRVLEKNNDINTAGSSISPPPPPLVSETNR
jgi:hypothetical protein